MNKDLAGKFKKIRDAHSLKLPVIIRRAEDANIADVFGLLESIYMKMKRKTSGDDELYVRRIVCFDKLRFTEEDKYTDKQIEEFRKIARELNEKLAAYNAYNINAADGRARKSGGKTPVEILSEITCEAIMITNDPNDFNNQYICDVNLFPEFVVKRNGVFLRKIGEKTLCPIDEWLENNIGFIGDTAQVTYIKVPSVTMNTAGLRLQSKERSVEIMDRILYTFVDERGGKTSLIHLGPDGKPYFRTSIDDQYELFLHNYAAMMSANLLYNTINRLLEIIAEHERKKGK